MQQTVEEFSVNDLRMDMAKLINMAVFGKKRIVLTRHHKRVCAIVCVEDLEKLENVKGERNDF